MTSMKYTDLNKCRVCLREPQMKITLETLNSSADMESVLNFCDIKAIEGLPNAFCTQCATKLDDFVSFKNQCIYSQSVLLGHYNNYIKTNELHNTVEEVKEEKLTDVKLEEIVKYEDNNTYDSDKDGDLQNQVSTDDRTLNETPRKVTHRHKKFIKVKRKERNKTEPVDVTKGELSCHRCSFKCNDESELIEHTQNKHDTECNICKKKFVNNRNLRRHREKHQTDRPKFFCHICKKFYDSKQSYEIHVKKFHSNNRQEKTVCSLCGISVYQIKSHLKSKHSDPANKIRCTYCDKIFKSQSSLRCHTLIYHENPEGYMSLCSQCGRVFRTSSELQAHVRMKHSTERKYQCRHCSKTFKSCGHRGTHEKIVHFNYRRYKCDMCSKAFSAKAILDNHVRTHTGEKPFVCEICFRPFAQKTALRTHMKLVHGLGSNKTINKSD